MKKYFPLLFTILVLVLLPFKVTIRASPSIISRLLERLAIPAQDIKYPVLERLAIPEGSSYDSSLGYCTDTVYFTLFITEDTLAPSQAFGFVPLETGRTWVSTIRTVTEAGEHRYEAFVYQQVLTVYEPTDIDEDGDTDFKDLWLVLIKLVGGML